MALPSLVSFDDFSSWEAEPVLNEPRATAILAAASTLVRAHTGRVWVDASGEEDVSEVALAVARHVVTTVASRVYNNPLGDESETVGPFSRRVADWAALGAVLTDEEKAQLASAGAPSPPTGIPGLGSVRLIAPAAARGTVYFNTDWWEDLDSEQGEGDVGS